MSDGNTEDAVEGEKTAPQPTPSEPNHSLGPGEESKKTDADATSGHNAGATAEGESTVWQSVPSEPSHSPGPGKARKESRAEGEGTEQRPIPSGPNHSLAPRKKKKTKKEKKAKKENHQHQQAIQILIRVEIVLIIVTTVLAIATTGLIFVTLKLFIVTSELASITKGEAQAGKKSTKSVEEKNQGLNAKPALKDDIQKINHILHIIKPIIGSNFNCSVSKDGERWTLHEAELCYDLKIPIQNSDKLDSQTQLWIEFIHDDRFWDCPPAERDKDGKSMTTNLVSCFLDNRQERKGNIEFVVKTNRQGEQ